MEYYSLIAGLPDINPDDTKALMTLDALKADISENVTLADQQDLNLFFYGFDNANLYAMLSGNEGRWSTLGTLTKEELEDFIAFAKDGKIHQDEHLPPYFADFITAYLSESPLYNGMSWEDQLTTLYYLYAIDYKSEFVASYFEFNLNLQNVLAAFSARRHGIDVSAAVIGNTEVSENIKTNTSKDFGIAAMFPYLDEALRINEAESPLEREQRIDALRWAWLADNTVFNYFTKERIFAYMLQLEMLERWLKMDAKDGTKAFADYVKDLVSSVQINIIQ